MAGKLDKVEGVFVIICDKTNKAYIGKSSGVGGAIRSAKSKLKKGNFHNKNLQIDLDKYGWSEKLEDGVATDGLFYVETHLVEEGELLGDTLIRIKNELLEDNFIPYNDIEYVGLKGEKEVVNALEELVGRDLYVVEKVIEWLSEGRITSGQLSDQFEAWEQQGL